MKKILLATSILAASAGFASAEVALSGAGRMGLVHDGVDTEFSSRIRVVFSMSGTTDGGLEFGASVRNDQSGVGNTANGDSTVYISGAFGKLIMGDTGDAVDSLVGQVSGVGYTGNGDLNEIGFIGRDVTGAMYEYSTGALTFGVGVGQTTNQDANLLTDDYFSVAAKYAGDSFTVALGYAENNGADQVSALGSASFGSATVKLKLSDQSTGNGDLAAALSVDYVAGAATITAFATDNRDFAGTDTMGLGVAYDLGGGASMLGGISKAKGTSAVADLGLTFSF